jgi:superfamily II DNA/RNA helicase
VTDPKSYPCQSTGPDLTETTTASREPTDAEPRVAEHPAAKPIAVQAVGVEATDDGQESHEQASRGPDEPVEPNAASPNAASPGDASPGDASPGAASPGDASPGAAAADATQHDQPLGAEPLGAEPLAVEAFGDGAQHAAAEHHAEAEAPHNAAEHHGEADTQHAEAEAPHSATEHHGEADPRHADQTQADQTQADQTQADQTQAAQTQAGGDDGHDDDDEQPSLIPIAAGPPPEPARTVFADLGLSAEVLRAIDDMGYRHPTPIQEQAIPYVLMGRDVMGTAQTGTGKTAGFTLPMLDILSGSRARARMPRSLILEPTRELALQVAENFVQYGKNLKLTHALIIGGESMSDQKEVLNRGVDVLIATPGRLLDMFDRGTILLSDTKLLVIDEADRMLDMGFIPDVERIVAMLPSTRQTLFFSATMGPEIRRLVDAFLTNPKEIAVSRAASVATTITEGIALVAEHDKREALRRLIRSQNVQNALIFCNRKRDVDILHKSLSKHNFDAGALHGDMAQTVRFATLEKFKANELRLLVCSDVAARGLDIGGLSHVFNFDVPIHAEDYVHRIGRTGRAGLEGKAFTIASPDDRYAVEQIEKLINHPIPPILVEGLDPVDWAERDGRKRRGRKPAETKKSADKAKREAGDKVEKPRAERKRAERVRPEQAGTEAARPEGAKPEGTKPEGTKPEGRRAARARPDRVRPESPELELALAPDRPARRDEPRRDDTRRSDARRDEPRPRHDEPRPRHDEPRRADSRHDEPRRADSRHDEPRRADSRHDEPRRADSRHDEPRGSESRRDEPRRDDHRRERYRRDDDLGPAVVGFGDDVPAFMLLRVRPPQVAESRETDA